mgnify:CR=1 FL=1
MEKEIKIEFNAQAKSVIEKVGITYRFTDSESIISNEEILKEVLEQEPPILDAVPRQWVGWDMMTAQLKTLKKA